MKVSIVIPTYNRASTIQRAIDSCIAQDYSDIEIIVVDDGSTDNTEGIIRRKYQSQIIYYKQENAGVCEARNKGIELSTGDIICFLDSDDQFMQDKVSHLAELFAQDPSLYVVINGALKIYDDNTKIASESKDTQPSTLKSDDILLGKIIAAGSLITIKAGIKNRFDAQIPASEDVDFILRIIKSKKGLYFPKLLTKIHKTLKIPRISTNHLDRIKGWEETIKILHSYNISKQAIDKYISKTHWQIFQFSLLNKDVSRIKKYKTYLFKYKLGPFKRFILYISPILILPIAHKVMTNLVKFLWNKNLIK